MEAVFYHPDVSEYKLFSAPKSWIQELLNDIREAKKHIYIEIFRFNDDEVGRKVGEALIKRATEGLDVKVIVDSWGTRKTSLIKKMEHAGIMVRFFKKIVFSLLIISKNHERNHRKIIAIDDEICYIGSANFSHYSLNWRESILRIKGEIAPIFKKIFLDNFKNYKKQIKFRKYYKTIHFKEFLIIRETPSIHHQQTRKYFMRLIESAQKSITIITPYFLPGKILRKKMIRAAKRGIHIQVIIPQNSDVKIADYMRNVYLGQLHNNGVDIRLYQNANIHAKLLLVDDKVFSIGSSNFDYRSFRYMYEINLSGENQHVSSLIKGYVEDTLINCVEFSYLKWINRPFLERFFAFLLVPFRKLL